MRTIQDYVSEARKKQNIYSNNKLALAIGITGPAIVNIAKGKTLPAEETLIKLADLAEIPREEALIDLSIWKAKSPEAKSTWEKLRKMVISICLIMTVICPVGSGDFTASSHNA